MAEKSEAGPEPLFVNLNPDDPDENVTEIESLCMNCFKQGSTRIMLTRIPFFKEVIVSSFSCPECGHKDSTIQPGGRIQPQGVIYSVTISTMQDLNRQAIKSDYGTFKIPHLEFEQPSNKRGEITTVEGMIKNVIRDLEMYLPERKVQDRENAEKVEQFLTKMRSLLVLEAPFQIILDDPSGNSFVENPSAPKKDPATQVTHYKRTKEQLMILGLAADVEEEVVEEEPEQAVEAEGESKSADLRDEVLTFPTNCPECNSPCFTNMKLINIPFFKEVVIMATTCEACGFRDSEAKGGQGIEDKGVKITLHLTDTIDLSRDILKSDTSGLGIPELELELQSGTLGGRFTTVEGLLLQIVTELDDKNPFMMGDSSQNTEHKTKIKVLCGELRKIAAGERLGVHLVLDDPAGNSYLQNIYAPDDDPEMKTEHYKRSFEQNEELGLNDMNTENYAHAE